MHTACGKADLLLPARLFCMQRDYVRYLGSGSTVLCLHHSAVTRYDVCLPPAAVGLSVEVEAAWLLEEAKGLTEVGGPGGFSALPCSFCFAQLALQPRSRYAVRLGF